MTPRRWARYVAIGDSTTEGLEDPDGQGGYRGWANRFAQHLADAFGEVSYANLAVRGLTAGTIRQSQLTRALSLEPDLATVVAGVNDMIRPRFDAEAVAGEVAQMIAALTSRGVTVVTFTMPDLTRVMPLARLVTPRLEALNERLRETCARTGALLLDVARHDVGGDPRLWHDDRLHANARGHERIGRGLAHTVGLPGFDDWASPLESAPAPTWRQRAVAEWRWGRDHLWPWVARHARGRSSADGRHPKLPELTRVVAAR